MIIDMKLLVTGAEKIGTTLFEEFKKKKEFESIFKKVRKELIDVYEDFAVAHFNSATQALTAMRTSSKPELEIRAFISHVRDAHNIYKALLEKKYIKTEGILFFKTETELNSVSGLKRIKLFKGNCILATYVSVAYASLNEKNNAVDWKNLALVDYEKYSDNLRKITPDDYVALCDELGIPNPWADIDTYEETYYPYIKGPPSTRTVVRGLDKSAIEKLTKMDSEDKKSLLELFNYLKI